MSAKDSVPPHCSGGKVGMPSADGSSGGAAGRLAWGSAVA